MISSASAPRTAALMAQENSAGPGGASQRERAMSWMATTLVLLNLGLAALLLAGVHGFGSVASAVAYLRGNRLIPDEFAKNIGSATEAGHPSVTFCLTNWTQQPIKVLGAQTSCTCLMASDLPAVVPPQGQFTLRLSARAKSGLGPYSTQVRLFTDHGASDLVLNVGGVFR